ncbi:hypothetical protein ACQSSU_20880 [Micromonospora echinospora]
MNSGRRWSRRETVHPIWCDVTRCLSPYAGTQGEHRSEPVRRHMPGIGVVVATLTQMPGRSTRLDVTLSTPVPTAPGGGGRRDASYAERVLAELADTLTRVNVLARADAIPATAHATPHP